MAPLYKAVDVHEGPNEGEYRSYTGEMDPDWSVGAVPNGGYVLALLVEACIQYQTCSAHPDPIHVTAHYLRTSVPSLFTINVRTVKSGRGFTNLVAELHQQGALIITTHQVFGVNSSSMGPPAAQPPGLTVVPPSPYARRIPLYTHPSTAIIRPMRPVWKFGCYIDVAPDPYILKKNALNHPNRATATTIGGEGLEWGAWLTFKDKGDEITNPALAFLVDIFTNMPALMPPSARQGLRESWFPTMVLTIEFKAPIPQFSATGAARHSVGLYSSGKFMNDSRHDGYVEVWTAPCNIGEGQDIPGWREKQVCLAIATQMAYVVPLEVNLKRGEKREIKL